MKPTYQELANELLKASPNMWRNRYRQSLTRWLSHHGEQIGDECNDELISGTDEEFSKYIEPIVESTTTRSGKLLSAGSWPSVRHGLRTLRSTALKIRTDSQLGKFSEALDYCRRSLGMNKDTFGKAYGKSAIIQSWLRGSSLPRWCDLPILERILGDVKNTRPKTDIPNDLLISRLPVPTKPRQKAEASSRLTGYSLPAQGWTFLGTPSHPFVPDEGPDLKPNTQIGGIHAFRSGRNIWRILPNPELTSDLFDFYRHKISAECHWQWTENANGRAASLDGFAAVAARYFGFLVTEVHIPLERLCFAMLGDRVLLEAFLKFCMRRGKNGNARQFVIGLYQLVVSHYKHKADVRGYFFDRRNFRKFQRQLADDITGYLGLTQVRRMYVGNPELRGLRDTGQGNQAFLADIHSARYGYDDSMGEKNPAPISDASVLFEQWCKLTEGWMSGVRRSLGIGRRRPSHQGGMPSRVQQVIDRYAQPLDFIFQLIEKMKADLARLLPHQHTHALDQEYKVGLITAMAAIPLREENWRTARLPQEFIVRSPLAPKALYNYTSNLYQKDGLWRYRERRDAFKNRRYMDAEWYDVPIPSWAQADIDRLIRVIRSQYATARDGSPFLFIPMRASSNGVRKKPWDAIPDGHLSSTVRTLTKRYLGVEFNGHDLSGLDLGFHWIRHLWATGMLAEHPQAFKFVAKLLNDDIDTVIRAYDRSNTEQAFHAADEFGQRIIARARSG